MAEPQPRSERRLRPPRIPDVAVRLLRLAIVVYLASLI
jgi:hypothetical protein